MRSLLALALLAMIAACGSTEAPPHPLEKTLWHVPAANDPRPITLQFDATEKRVSGFSGCNRFSGSYTLEQNQISFGPLMSTKMACADAARNTTEQTFLDALSRTDSYLYENDTLTLFDAHALQLLKLRAQSAK